MIEAAIIQKAIETVQKAEGDLYDTAAVLLQILTQSPAFENGNKRTMFLSTKNLN
jgi:prophage maintenance system killer protein